MEAASLHSIAELLCMNVIHDTILGTVNLLNAEAKDDKDSE